ncbi:DMT family transporter [Bacillus sp. ISL-18]|uniref:DMT family transporter n=1 Tax=Bacillus sp. ISL-18 TaxID=2819118 RepID=UPI001BE6B67E|nr:DMT family transporter [Bacillus sp. ISL-18]MBT2658527.1 DMT family transporter [Bacillus sp. ISL-18]
MFSTGLYKIFWKNNIDCLKSTKNTLSGFLFLKESLNSITLLGIALVLSGVWLVNHTGSTRISNGKSEKGRDRKEYKKTRKVKIQKKIKMIDIKTDIEDPN